MEIPFQFLSEMLRICCFSSCSTMYRAGKQKMCEKIRNARAHCIVEECACSTKNAGDTSLSFRAKTSMQILETSDMFLTEKSKSAASGLMSRICVFVSIGFFLGNNVASMISFLFFFIKKFFSHIQFGC